MSGKKELTEIEKEELNNYINSFLIKFNHLLKKKHTLDEIKKSQDEEKEEETKKRKDMEIVVKKWMSEEHKMNTVDGGGIKSKKRHYKKSKSKSKSKSKRRFTKKK
jgi:hypothetical protein